MPQKLATILKSGHQKVSDKWSSYLPFYQEHLAPFQKKSVNILEIGVQNGGSLEVWARFFPEAKAIVGCDINPKCGELKYDDARVHVIVGDAGKEEIKSKIEAVSRRFDIIIDDGSHRSGDIVTAFARYFPLLEPGGVYIAEDLHASYFQDYEGGAEAPFSSMSFFKRLTDYVNIENWSAEVTPDELVGFFSEHWQIKFDMNSLNSITEVIFRNSLVLVRKGNEGENSLGQRVITGTSALVEDRVLSLDNSAPLKRDESRNQFGPVSMRLEAYPREVDRLKQMSKEQADRIMSLEGRLQREISKSRELVHELNAQRCAIEAHLDSVVRELKNVRRKPLKQFGQLVKYKVLRGLSMARPIVSERAASRFARSAAKRHPSRVRPLPDILVDQHCSSPLNATAASDSALDTFADEVRTVHMLKRNHFFDSAWYKQQYGAQIGLVDPAMHFLRTGWRLGFDPSPHFLTRNYLDIYSDVRAADVNPLLHFLGSGLLEGRSPKPSPRVSALGVLRMGPEETGRPDEILKFDDEPTPVVGIENEKIAVHVHLYFTDMADDIVGRLINIRHPFTLLVSVSEGNDKTEWQAFFAERLPVATTILVKVVPNIGRDVAPWLVNFADEVRENTIICHIHTKKSEHNSAHRGWFRYLGHTTLGSPNVVDSILRLLIGEERSGIVAPCYFWTLASQPNYGKNGGAVKKLFARLVDEPLPEKCPDYPAGSFFWARVEALAPLLDLALTTEDFEAEEEAIDGTLAHAVERMIGLLPVVTGLDLKMVTVDVAYDLINFLNNQRTNFKLPQLPAPAVARRAMQDERSVLYSCVSGGYEAVSDLVLRRQDADLVFFSDLEGVVPPNGFEARLSNYISPEPVRTARFVKTHPHVWFPQHKWAIWCDANIHFMGDLHTYIERVRSAGAEAGFIAHPVRETMQQEAEVLLENGIVKDATEVERQIARYLKDVPEIITSRLIETNFFVADLSSPNVQRFFQMWWSEINRYSHRDQLSINYAIERTGLEWVKLMPEGHSVRDRNDFLLFAHDFSSRDEIIAEVRSIDDVA